jgi:hypothetical protein
LRTFPEFSRCAQESLRTFPEFSGNDYEDS